MTEHHDQAGGHDHGVIDPVCGMTVDTQDGKPSAEHAGATWWFCSDRCRTRFLADPDRYLKPEARPAEPAPSSPDGSSCGAPGTRTWIGAPHDGRVQAVTRDRRTYCRIPPLR